MPISQPWNTATAAEESPESGSNWGHEYEHDRARAHASAGEYREDHPDATETNEAEVVQFPRATTDVAVRDQPPLPAKLKTATGVWVRDARQHAGEVFDGSVYTVRPPSARDRVERWKRAEWAGDIPAVRTVGKTLGALPLGVDLLVDIVRWFLTPGRFYIALAVAALVFVLAF